MAIDRPNAVQLGHAKDKLGFPCIVLEDPDTGDRMISYEPEVWWERNRYIQTLKSLNRQVPEDYPETTPVEVDDGCK